MKERYLDVMARVVNVYTPQRFDDYIARTRDKGVKEHGFPRLCANIGILNAHGRLLDLQFRFEEMMELCCRDMPVCSKEFGTRGNDFSVREILAAVLEVEKANLYPDETITRWKQAMAAIDPCACYRMVAPTPPKAVDNWAAFNAAGEQLRCNAGLAQNLDYIENQIASQMLCFDESGMYCDPNDPMVYDLVGRNMLSTCLYYGYSGMHKKQLEQNLRRAGLLTLQMQSVTGELAYGGRSNQFIHNEAHLAVSFEFEAAAHYISGNTGLAGKFRSAANLALDCIERWLDQAPGQHIKNYYPIDSMIGCEKYAYYDKYMVTVASFLYLAYLFCDERIAATSCPAIENGCYTLKTSDAFRKLFCKAGPYFVETELQSDHHYDAEGIGRIHRRNAPSAICLSVPCSKEPNYSLPAQNPMHLSICCGKLTNAGWQYGFDEGAVMSVAGHYTSGDSACGQILCKLPNSEELKQTIVTASDGVNIQITGAGIVGLSIPAFAYDGKTETQIIHSSNKLAVCYKNWVCTYTSDGLIEDLHLRASNRNGSYQMFRAKAIDELHVHITIEPRK